MAGRITKEILKEKLEEKGYDGFLRNDKKCQCDLNNIGVSDSPNCLLRESCTAGYKITDKNLWTKEELKTFYDKEFIISKRMRYPVVGDLSLPLEKDWQYYRFTKSTNEEFYFNPMHRLKPTAVSLISRLLTMGNPIHEHIGMPAYSSYIYHDFYKEYFSVDMSIGYCSSRGSNKLYVKLGDFKIPLEIIIYVGRNVIRFKWTDDYGYEEIVSIYIAKNEKTLNNIINNIPEGDLK